VISHTTNTKITITRDHFSQVVESMNKNHDSTFSSHEDTFRQTNIIKNLTKKIGVG